MKKSIIFVLVAVILVGGFLYVVLEKGDKNISDNNNEKPVENIKPNKPNDEDNEEKDNNDIVDNIKDEYILQIGRKMPNFTLENLQGKEVSLSDYEGKIVLVNFWATWCKFCDAEMPDLQRLSEENEDLVVLGVNVGENHGKVEKYINKGGYNFEVLLDEDKEIAQDYLVSGLPASYFADEKGVFLGRVPGMLTYEQMNQILNDIREN
ncbi:TlpA family protein disulfide reductase [Wansuia hejianensis]|uniref:TlpA family protein disulfide reductase n=1 Tax=Wansuia hejianensis TaxID=2763667 RepID=A0A926IMY5_9FIRM|nr:TlpA disulfide reductase family protein [Wansuia hejianensis]MBC8590925.1 TlpA family protein disulfide reductase [Wansuia hejianensis]